jgi:hypothetical protein
MIDSSKLDIITQRLLAIIPGSDSMSKNKLYKPGEKVPRSGQAEIVGPRGGKTGEGERTVVKGEPFPPTPKPGQQYKIVDPTKNK